MLFPRTLARNALVLTMLTGCGQIASTLPAIQNSPSTTVAAERSVVSPILVAKLAIKKQLEYSMPDNGFKFATLEVAQTPLGHLYTFKGTAHVTTIAGTALYSVAGTYNAYTGKAVLTKKDRLNPER